MGRGQPGEVAVRINDDRFFPRVLSGGNLGLGESYMDGDWDMEQGDIGDLLTILLRNRLDREIRGDAGPRCGGRRADRQRSAQRNWSHAPRHYDQGDDLFRLPGPGPDDVLVRLHAHPDDTAEQLQANKLERICQKLDIREGDRVLDIGCGFGGMLIYAAKHFGATGVGITTSLRHQAFGTRRIAEAGLADRVRWSCTTTEM